MLKTIESFCNTDDAIRCFVLIGQVFGQLIKDTFRIGRYFSFDFTSISAPVRIFYVVFQIILIVASNHSKFFIFQRSYR